MIVSFEAQGTKYNNRYAMCPVGHMDKNQQASSQKFRQLI